MKDTKTIILAIIAALLVAGMIYFGIYARQSEQNYDVICIVMAVATSLVFFTLQSNIDFDNVRNKRKKKR